MNVIKQIDPRDIEIPLGIGSCSLSLINSQEFQEFLESAEEFSASEII